MPTRRAKRKRSPEVVVLELKDDPSYTIQEELKRCCQTIADHSDSYSAAEPLEFPDVYQEGVRLLENYSCNFEAKPETEKEAFFRKLSWDEKVKVVVAAQRLGYAELFKSLSQHMNKVMSDMIRKGERQKVLELLQLKDD